MFCAISGEIPKDPVVSKKTGIIFEKSLIEKYVASNGDSCPITNTPLTVDDLLPIHVSSGTASRPRLPLSESSSIPGLLTTFQNEWDEVMLETFTLKQHLDSTRKELSHSLFQHEAACRVIARLKRELDEAHHMISTLQTSGVTNGTGNSIESSEMEVAPPPKEVAAEEGLEADVLQEINAKCKELSSGRKGRKVSDKVTTKEAMTTLSHKKTHTPHKSDKTAGVTCLAVASSGATTYTLSGSMDKVAILMDLSSGKPVAKLTGHTKKVSAVGFIGSTTDRVVTASADKSVKVFLFL